MVHILDGNSEYVAHAKENKSFGEKSLICDCSRSNQMTETNQMIEIAPYVWTYFLATI